MDAYYTYDKDGFYTGEVAANKMDGGLPPNATPKKPIEVGDGEIAHWNGSAWEKADAPSEKENKAVAARAHQSASTGASQTHSAHTRQRT